jgi:hypothetical protein
VTPRPDLDAHVDLMAGVWAVAAVLLAAAIIAAALYPILRAKENPMRCRTPGSLGAHPLGPPDEAGRRVCSCGLYSELPRTDTQEIRIPDNPGGFLAAATGHPSSIPLEELATEERYLPHVVWPPAPGR